MSDKMRWRYGDTNPVVAAVDSETVIEIGDLLWQDVDDAKPASLENGQSEETSEKEPFCDKLRRLFASNFLGVAMERSRDGDTTLVRVATTGVFEFDCLSETFELGDLMGVYTLQGSGGANSKYLQKQMVEKVEWSKRAIARVAKREASATTSVLVDVRSTVMTGGVEGGSRSDV